MTDVVKWIRSVNEANGFDAPTWDTLPTKLMLVVTELNEARNCVHEDECHLAEELADTAIRLIDILDAIWTDGWQSRMNTTHVGVLFNPIEQKLWAPVDMLCRAVEAWRHENQVDARIAIELALRDVMSYGEALGFNMLREIHTKVERNEKRGHLHGKKRSE